MRVRLTAGALALLALVAGCGGGGKGAGTSTSSVRFPAAGGEQLARLTQAPSNTRPQLAVAVSVLQPGSNRLGFALIDASGRQLDSPAAVYTAAPNGTRVRGPFPARLESLRVRPPFASKTAAQDPDAAKTVSVAQVPFARDGRYVALAVVRERSGLVASTATPVTVGGPQPVAVGAPAPRIHTPTVASVGGDIGRIDTRIPHDDMHRVDFAAVVGRKPAVIVFATPQLCQSRVCGPVVDEVAQLQSEFGDRAAFIHMEVYRDNKIEHGLRPQLLAFGLRTEPWVFTIDRGGHVAARIESAASVDEIRQAVERALR